MAERRICTRSVPIHRHRHSTGWRVQSEVVPLQWRLVDFAAGRVRLDPGTAKNPEGRVFPLTVELRRLLEAQHRATDEMERERGIVCPWVFHRNGLRIKDFRYAWQAAPIEFPMTSAEWR